MTCMIDAQAQHAKQTNDAQAYVLHAALVAHGHAIFTNLEHEFSIVNFVIDNPTSVCPAISAYVQTLDIQS